MVCAGAPLPSLTTGELWAVVRTLLRWLGTVLQYQYGTVPHLKSFVFTRWAAVLRWDQVLIQACLVATLMGQWLERNCFRSPASRVRSRTIRCMARPLEL